MIQWWATIPGRRSRHVALKLLSAGTHETASRVVGTGGGDGKAVCASLGAALAEDLTLRPSLATVAARCR